MINKVTREITLYKQDTVKISFALRVNGEIHALEQGEKVMFTVKKDTLKESPILFEQTLETVGETQIDVVLTEELQEELPYGDYLYDLRYFLKTGKQTGIKPTALRVLPVVGWWK